MEFKYLTPAEFDALSEYKKEKYLEDKSKFEAKQAGDAAKKAATEVVEEAVATVKTELTSLIDAAKGETAAVSVKLDEAQKELDAYKAENNRIRIAAKENEKNGKFFDEAFKEAVGTDEIKEQLKDLQKNQHAKVTLVLKDVGTMGISSITDISMA